MKETHSPTHLSRPYISQDLNSDADFNETVIPPTELASGQEEIYIVFSSSWSSIISCVFENLLFKTKLS